MTLRDLILSIPGYVDATDPTDAAVEAFLIAGSGVFTSRLVNTRELMREFGAKPAANFLDKLEAEAPTNNILKWVMRFITGEGIDVGDPQTRGQLDALVTAAVITNGERNAVQGLATELLRWQTTGVKQLIPADIPRERKG